MPRRQPAVARRVEHGEQAPFELLAAGHADRERRRAMTADRVRDLEKMPRIVARRRAGEDHAIVAGELALDPQAPGHPPHHRVEPIERAGHEGERLRETVVPRDVRQLVKDHGPPAIVQPRIGHGGNEDRRLPGAECHRHAPLAAANQPNQPADAHRRRRVTQEPGPVRIAHVARLAREPADAPELYRDLHQHDEHARGVHAGHDPGP